MMYWGIFVLTVLTASGLVQSNEEENFRCPVCRGRGADPKAKCDKKIKLEYCNRPNAICEATNYTHGVFVRLCSDTETYKTSVKYCQDLKNCEKAMCTESECMAEFPTPLEENFRCPVCRGRGADPKAECDKKIKLEYCNRPNAICEATNYTHGVFVRLCSDTETYKTSVKYCQDLKNCEKAMCTESECMAEFPTPLECPFCRATGKKAQEDCDKKITYRACKTVDSMCGVRRSGSAFQRGCIRRYNFNRFLERCRNSRKPCAASLAVCDKPRCKAEFLECPFCRATGKKAQEDCDKKITYKACKTVDSMCGVRRSGSAFQRGCIRRYNFNRFLERCRNSRKPCAASLAVCDKPRCKAEFPVTECPYCESFTSLEDCDNNIETQKCKRPETRCFVRKQEYGPTQYFMRGCMDEETAKETALDCTEGDLKDVCQFGTCQEPGCLASFEN